MISGTKYPQIVRTLRMLVETVLRVLIQMKGVTPFTRFIRVLDDRASRSKTTKMWTGNLVKTVSPWWTSLMEHTKVTGLFIICYSSHITTILLVVTTMAAMVPSTIITWNASVQRFWWNHSTGRWCIRSPVILLLFNFNEHFHADHIHESGTRTNMSCRGIHKLQSDGKISHEERTTGCPPHSPSRKNWGSNKGEHADRPRLRYARCLRDDSLRWCTYEQYRMKSSVLVNGKWGVGMVLSIVLLASWLSRRMWKKHVLVGTCTHLCTRFWPTCKYTSLDHLIAIRQSPSVCENNFRVFVYHAHKK